MVDANRNLTKLERRQQQENRDDLPSLLERLATDLGTLFDTKVALLKSEVKEDVSVYLHGAVIILGGAIVTAIGFALVNIALAFVVSTLFVNLNLSQPAKYALGFVLTGLLYLVIGLAVIVLTKNRLVKQGIVPRRTVAELERDKEWLQEEL